MKEEWTERNTEIDNEFGTSKDIKIEPITYQESPSALDEIFEENEKFLKSAVLCKPNLGLENLSLNKLDNNLSVESSDTEKQLEVMSFNLRNSKSKISINKVFDFSKKITFPTTESNIKIFPTSEEPDLIIPPLKKNLTQNVSKIMLGKESENNKEENSISQLSTRRATSSDRFIKRPQMLDIQDPNDKIIATKEIEPPNFPLNDQNSSKASSTENMLHVDDYEVVVLNSLPKKGFKKSNSLRLDINNSEPSLKKIEINVEPEENKVSQDLILAKPVTKSVMKKKKPTFSTSLALDIDTINENYTFGGEQGKQLASDMDDVMDKLFKEVSEIAQRCVAYMSKFAINLIS